MIVLFQNVDTIKLAGKHEPMKRLIVLFAFVFATIVAAAQELIAVRGKVVDENGKPVSAASIVVAGGHTATVSNEDGFFTIKVPESARQITVSHLGYQSETVHVQSGKALRVKLISKAIMLNGVKGKADIKGYYA